MENILIFLLWLLAIVFLEQLAKKRKVEELEKPIRRDKIVQKEEAFPEDILKEVKQTEVLKMEVLEQEEGKTISPSLPKEKFFETFDAQKAVIYSEIILPPRAKRRGLFLFKMTIFFLILANLSVSILYASSKEKKELKSGTVIQKIKTPRIIPEGIAFDGKYLWVVALSLREDLLPTIYKISPINGKVLSFFPAPGEFPEGLSFDGHYLWNIDLNTKNDLVGPLVYKINLNLKKATVAFSASELPSGSIPAGIAWDGKYLWCVDSYTHNIFKLDSLSGKILHKFKAPANYPSGIAYNKGFLWMASILTQKIYKISPKEGEVAYSFCHPGTYPYGLAFENEYLWVGDYLNNTLYKIIP